MKVESCDAVIEGEVARSVVGLSRMSVIRGGGCVLLELWEESDDIAAVMIEDACVSDGLCSV